MKQNFMIYKERKFFIYLLPFIFLFLISFASAQDYGGMYIFNQSGATFPFAVENFYYNFSGLTCGISKGIACDGTALTINISGEYTIHYVATGIGLNNHLYHSAIAVDGVLKNRTSAYVLATSGDTVSMTGIGHLTLQSGQQINLQIADLSGTGTGSVYSSNIIIEQMDENANTEEKNQYNYLYLFAILLGFLLFIIGRMKEDNLMLFMSGLLFLAFALIWGMNGHPGLVYENYINTTILLCSWGLAIYIMTTTVMNIAKEGL